MTMIEQGEVLADSIVDWGAGLVALVLVFGIAIFLVRKIPPYLKAMSEQATLANEVIRVNSQFMGEMTKSNQNMSRALDLMAPIFERTVSLLEEHDLRAQSMQNEISKISERTFNCNRRFTDHM